MRVLFVNHRSQNCGVYQFFKRLTEPALASGFHECSYIETDEAWECQHWINQLTPDIIVFNFYTHATMPWLDQGFLDRQSAKKLCLFHEVPIGLRFDGIVHQDPSDPKPPGWYHISRPIPLFTNTYRTPDVPTFGSFGFGLGGKGFGRIVEKVQEEYDEAIIRINIPFAQFGDADGRGARDWAADCRRRLTNTGISLEVTHDFMDETSLLDFLANNTCNCFFYDENYGRGISGTLDYALAVERPIAITKSWQFKHFWTVSDVCLIEQHSLHDIIAAGVEATDIYRDLWSYSQVRRDWDTIFNIVGEG